MRRLLLAIILILFACPSWAEVLVNESTEYYPVDGLGKKAILRNLKTQSPIIIKGKRFHGHTRAKTRYKFTWVQHGDTCSLKKVIITLSIIYKYPKLTSPQSKKTLQWWNEHLEKLKKHELIHGKIAKDGAHELDQELGALTKLKCSTAKAKIQSVAKQILNKTKKRQAQYDVLTEHGKKQERYTGQI